MPSSGKRQSLSAVKDKLSSKRSETSKRLANCAKLYQCMHPGATDEDVTNKSKDYKTIREGSQKEINELSEAAKQMEDNFAGKRKAPMRCLPSQLREKIRAKTPTDLQVYDTESDSDSDSDVEDEDGDSRSNDEEVAIKEAFLSQVRKTKESKLYMALQGLQSKTLSSRDDSLTVEPGSEEKAAKTIVDSVTHNGRVFLRNHCYQYQLPKVGKIIIGITGFYSETEAQVVLVVPFSETFLGVEDEGVDFKATFEPSPYFKVQATVDSISLKDLEEDCVNVQTIPDWVFKPSVEGDWLHFAYYCDGKRKRFGKLTGPARMIDLFAGAGIMSEGFHRSGFKTICAVENNPKAANAFQINSPETRVECMDINIWHEQYLSDEAYVGRLGRIDQVHASSPCQGFSKANRKGGKNDKVNNELSLAILDVLEKIRPTTASFENVPGMWETKNQHYLKKLLHGLMRLGYQVRCCLLRACDFGDPQARDRIIVLAALKCAYLPDRPQRTHGEGTSMHHVTVEDALDGLSIGVPESHQEFRRGHPRLVQHQPAKTIKASGSPPLHYAFNRHTTVEEMKALFSLRADYQLFGSDKDQRKQLGNSVPVELGAAIGRSVAGVQKYHYSQDN